MHKSILNSYVFLVTFSIFVGTSDPAFSARTDKAESLLQDAEEGQLVQQALRKNNPEDAVPARDSQEENGRLRVGGVTFPDEILLLIFSYLDPEMRGNALAVCKLWNRLILDEDWDKLRQFAQGEYDPKALAGLLKVMPEKFSFVLKSAHLFFHRESVKKYVPVFFTPETYPHLVEDGLAFAELFPELQVYVQGNPAVQEFLMTVLEQSNISRETLETRMKDVREHPSLKKGLGALCLLERVQPRIDNLPRLYASFLSYWDLKNTPTGNVMWCGYTKKIEWWKQQLSVIGEEPHHFLFLEPVIRAALKGFSDEPHAECFHRLLDSYVEHRSYQRAYKFLQVYCPKSLWSYYFLLDRIQEYMPELKGEEDLVGLQKQVGNKVEELLFMYTRFSENLAFREDDEYTSDSKYAARSLVRIYCQRGDYDKALDFVRKYFPEHLDVNTSFLEVLSEALMNEQRRESLLPLADQVLTDVESLVQRKEEALSARDFDPEEVGTYVAQQREYKLKDAKLTLLYVYLLRNMNERAKAFSVTHLPRDTEFCRMLEAICPDVRESLASLQSIGLVTEEMVEAQERSLFSQSELSSLRPAALALIRTYCQRGEFKKAHAFLDEYFGRDDLEAYTEFLDASFPAVMARKDVFGRQRLEYQFPMTEQTVLFRSADVIRKALSKETGHFPTLLAKARKVLSRFYFTFVSLDQLAATCNSYILDVLDLGDKDQ